MAASTSMGAIWPCHLISERVPTGISKGQAAVTNHSIPTWDIQAGFITAVL